MFQKAAAEGTLHNRYNCFVVALHTASRSRTQIVHVLVQLQIGDKITMVVRNLRMPVDARSSLTPVPGTCSAMPGQISAMDQDGAGVVA